MKHFLAAIVFLAMVTPVVGYAGTATQAEMEKSNQKVSVTGPAKLDKKGTIEISGQGFEPDANIVLLFNSSDGVKSDIGDAIKPVPVADAVGAWKTTWSYGRMVKKKIIKEGTYTIEVVNEDYEKLTSTSISFKK